MPTQSFDDFVAAMTSQGAPIDEQRLADLITTVFEVPADDVDDDVLDFAYSRIMLGYRTGDLTPHLRHLYDVLTVMQQQLAQS